MITTQFRRNSGMGIIRIFETGQFGAYDWFERTEVYHFCEDDFKQILADLRNHQKAEIDYYARCFTKSRSYDVNHGDRESESEYLGYANGSLRINKGKLESQIIVKSSVNLQ